MAAGKDSQKDKNAFAQHSSRDRILAAALKLFVEQGYFNTNIPDLSRESQCSVGSIYHTFKNKEEVASALYAEGIKAFRNALLHSVQNVADPKEAIKSVVKAFLHFSEVNRQLSKYLWLCRHNEFMTGVIQHPTKVGLDPLGRHLTKIIKSGISSGTFSDLKANIIWTVLFGIPAAYVRDWLDGYNSESPSKVSNQLADHCLKALLK